jgi:hypothetical protein
VSAGTIEGLELDLRLISERLDVRDGWIAVIHARGVASQKRPFEH